MHYEFELEKTEDQESADRRLIVPNVPKYLTTMYHLGAKRHT